MGLDKKPEIGDLIQYRGDLGTWRDWGTIGGFDQNDSNLCLIEKDGNAIGTFYWNNDTGFYRVKPEPVRPVDNLPRIAKKIADMALEQAPDYPKIKTCSTWEQLYAIECAIQGTTLANLDLHRLIDNLRKQLGITKEQVIELSDRILKEVSPG